MLTACAKSSRIKRVVVASSMAAMTDEPDTSRVLTEADWNEKSTLERNPYYLSKAAAERAAWGFVAKQSPSWDLVVINPFIVIGPAMTDSINESNIRRSFEWKVSGHHEFDLGLRRCTRRRHGPRQGTHHAAGKRALSVRG